MLPDGSALVTGGFASVATFGAGEANETILTSAGDSEIFLARYNADGTLAWVRSARGEGLQAGTGVAVLPDGSVLVTGWFQSAMFGAGEANETALTSAGDADIFLARYDAEGKVAWVRSAGGEGSQAGNGVAVLPDGSAFVTGEFEATATFGAGEANETTLTSAGRRDIFVARYNADGELAWARSAGGDFIDDATGVAVQPDGSVLVTGWFLSDRATFGAGEANETLLTSAGDRDIFLARYNADGTLAWARSAGGDGIDDGYDVAVLSNGSALVTGWFATTATFGAGEANETTLTSAGGHDIFLARYDADGRLAWARSAGGEGIDDRALGVGVLSDGSSMVTGGFESTATFGGGEANETTLEASPSFSDIFLARFAP